MLILAAALMLTPHTQAGLPPRIASWRTELERAGRRVAVARVYPDAAQNGLTLPHDTEHRSVFVGILSDSAFVAQFIDVHAVTVHFDDASRNGSYVLVNMARQKEFAGYEEALLAHEFAHIGLHIRGFRAPAVSRAATLCESMQAGDVVQHILIREELQRRGIDYVPFWVWTLEPALAKLRTGSGDPRHAKPCRRMARLTMWMDVWLGLPPRLWPKQGEFLQALASASPDLVQPAWGLYSYLYQRDVSHIEQYQAAIQFAMEIMQGLRRPFASNSSR